MKKLLAIIWALMTCSPAFAALRGTAQADTMGSTSTTITVDVSAIGIQANDVVLIFMAAGGSDNNNWTLPTGFSAITGAGGIVAGNSGCAIGYKVAGGSEPSSYTATSVENQQLMAQVRVYSGRNTSSPFSAVSRKNSTALSGATPATVPLTGVTAVAGDDLVVFSCYDNANTNTGQTYTFSGPSGFANALTDFYPAQYSEIGGSADYTDHAGGATGTLDASLAFSATVPSDFGGYVVSLAAGLSTIPIQGGFALSPSN